MRAFHRSVTAFVGLAVLAAGTSLAAPRKGKPASAPAPAPSNGDAGEVEMDGAGSATGTAPSTGASGSTDGGEIDMGTEDTPPPSTDLSADLAASDAAAAQVTPAGVVRTPLSWKDILVVVRKPFLKAHRTELYPFVGTTMNDNMVRHNVVGGELAYYLTDVLAIGVEGMYYNSSFREPFDLVARQARRLPTVNEYHWSAALDFHYIPVYGKFAVLDHKLITWEVAFTAGIGAGQSEVVPRDTKLPGFTNLLIQPNVGAGMRFFLTKWLTLNAGIRDYLFIDKFESVDRAKYGLDTDMAKQHGDTAFINNVMFQVGLSFWLPTSFEYTTFR